LWSHRVCRMIFLGETFPKKSSSGSTFTPRNIRVHCPYVEAEWRCTCRYERLSETDFVNKANEIAGILKKVGNELTMHCRTKQRVDPFRKEGARVVNHGTDRAAREAKWEGLVLLFMSFEEEVEETKPWVIDYETL
jgi:hypothetical protein